ncbi:unnamed protein product [Penicillium manginii]
MTSAIPDKVSPCRWAIGWQTPTYMVTSYLLAFTIAAIHGSLFYYLNGKPTEGPSAIFRQSYVTTGSMILVSIFGLSLRASLNASFTQYLWRILRLNTLELSKIEALFTMRSNPLSFFSACGIWNSWPLALTTIILWSIPIAMSFPPGSLTVISSRHEEILKDVVVPTFNATDYTPGNESMINVCYGMTPFGNNETANDKYTRFGTSILGTSVCFGKSPEITPEMPADIKYLTSRILNSGAVWDMPSPCGLNCTYTMRFTGPYLQCESRDAFRRIQQDRTEPSGSIPGAVNFMLYNSSSMTGLIKDSNSRSQSHHYFTTARPRSSPAIQVLRTYTSDNGSELSDRRYKVDVIETCLDCIQSKIDYTVQIMYRDNIRHISVSTNPKSVRSLVSVAGEHTTRPGDLGYYYNPGELNSTALTFWEDANLATIIFAMAGKLKETLNAIVYAEDREFRLNNTSQDYQYFDACSSGDDYISYLSRVYHTPLLSMHN